VLLLPSVLGSCSNAVGKRRHTNTGSATSDSVFAEVQARGHVAMGVDQYTSQHKFEPLPDGGRIALQRDMRDTAGVYRIRAHMTRIASAFGQGDFTLPGFVHAREVPGTREMRGRRSVIRYTADTVPGGAVVRLKSADSTAIAAIHQFLAFQRHDHRAP
jgi:hypothetical protein